jgi:hypothetical protein
MKFDKFSSQCYRDPKYDWTDEPCDAKNCKSCGLSGKFCAICKEPFVAGGDGICLEDCVQGYFEAKGHCYKCNP